MRAGSSSASFCLRLALVFTGLDAKFRPFSFLSVFFFPCCTLLPHLLFHGHFLACMFAAPHLRHTNPERSNPDERLYFEGALSLARKQAALAEAL